LVVVLGLNLAPVAALIVVGVTAHSVGVFAAGGDYLLDAAGIGVALIALALSRHSGTARRPGGFPNALNIAAVVNAGWLRPRWIGWWPVHPRSRDSQCLWSAV
jgi:cobalt-zinc-cadmium efflux system protein